MSQTQGNGTVLITYQSVTDKDDVAIVTMDYPPINAGSVLMRRDVLQAFQELANRINLKGVVLIGANNNFVGGADIREFQNPPQEPHLPEILEAIENLSVPVIAALDGAALGGGYELALACDMRIATPHAMVGLPEVTLGLIPGAGGTYRLPPLVGKAKAIQLITSGQRVKADEALVLGMVDEVTNQDLITTAIEKIGAGAKKRILRDLPNKPASNNDIALAEKTALKRARGAVAVGEAIAAIKQSGTDATIALAAERETSLRLRRSPQSLALQHLFFAERASSKPPEGAKASKLQKIGVVGAGRMGAGIALAFATRGFDVIIAEQNTEILDAARKGIGKDLDKMASRGRVVSAGAVLDRISFGTLSDMAMCELVVEAITEDMVAKKALFEALDGIVDQHTILASNTSYLDIDEIAAATKNPERVVGLHFFNPANIMKLVEIINAARTNPNIVATLVSLSRKLGKVPVVARVGDGFIGNRIFATYRAQCEFLLEEGAYPSDVDAAMIAFGMAMGPFAVFDLAGLDIAWAMRKRLAADRDADARYVTIADTLCEQGRFGRKTGKGWYDYTNGKLAPDPYVKDVIDLASLQKGITRQSISSTEIQTRLLSVIVNEACWALEDGIAARPGDIDLVLVHGYGFPKLKGGPLHWAARQPRAALLDAIANMVSVSGNSVKPAPNLSRVLDAALEI